MSEPHTAILAFIIAHKRDHDGQSPTLREIGAAVGIRSTSLVDFYLDKLQQSGLIVREHGLSRSIRVSGGKWDYYPREEVLS